MHQMIGAIWTMPVSAPVKSSEGNIDFSNETMSALEKKKITKFIQAIAVKNSGNRKTDGWVTSSYSTEPGP